MGHSATTVYMGASDSKVKEVINNVGDPATFLAGLCVHLTSAGALSLTASAGSKMGISLGKSLSGTKRVPVCTKGIKVPILLANGFTPTIGVQVQISTTTGKAVSSGTAVNAYYVTSTLTAYDEDGVAIADGAAYISFPGGL